MATVEMDMSKFRTFFQRMGKAAKGNFRKELEVFLESLGEEFLDAVQDAFIKRHKNTGYGQLVDSFKRDDKNNVWRYEDDGLTLEIGTSVKYANYVNDGHRQQAGRFIPGYWQGKRFIYDSSAESGMILKADWVEGLHFWEAAVHTMEKKCPVALEKKLQQWLDKYFDG